MEYRDDVRDNDALRASFNNLTRRTFGFDFSDWYDSGWWSAEHTAYTPHVLVSGGRVEANVSATAILFTVDGAPLRTLQLGTVMTAPEQRGRGMQRRLMEHVLEKAADYDLVYLYANETVTEFYPRFGFVPAVEYAFSCPMPADGPFSAVPADAGDPAGLRKLLALRQQGNPFSAVEMPGETGLFMFYCSGFLRDCVYFIDELNAAAVAELDEGTLLLHDVFCPEGTALEDVLSALAQPGAKRVTLGFTPKDPSGMLCEPIVEDGGLFILQGGKNPFAGRKMRLPTLSHT